MEKRPLTNNIQRSFFRSILNGLLLTLLFSCVVQEPRNLRKTKVYSKKTPVGKPQYGVQTQTFFQEGQTMSSSRMTLLDSLEGGFFLRGKEVHDSILKSQNAMVCLAVLFSSSDNTASDNLDRQLILAAFPKSFLNFSNNTREWYYFLKASHQNDNSNFCSSPANTFTSLQKSFSFKTLSANYTKPSIIGKTVKLFDLNGLKITNISTLHLSLQINRVSSSENPLTKTCSNSSLCQSLGYDCCSNGSCVKDGQQKGGSFENEPEYLQSVEDIKTNPKNYRLYPQYYNICTESPPKYDDDDGAPSSSIDPYDEKEKRLTMLQELYDCVTPNDQDNTNDSDSGGEMAICTASTENIAKQSTSDFVTGGDDRNFSTTYSGTGTLSNHSIYQIIHAGETLFSGGETLKTGFTIGTGNDNLSDTVNVNLTHTASTGSPDDTLKIRYKIDGSCTQINSSLAKCYKVYIQGQNDNKITDHYPASNTFKIPFYAEIGRSIKVEINGINKIQNVDWTLQSSSPPEVLFKGASLQVYDTQKIKISFFVNLLTYNVLQEKLTALNKINDICQCGGPTCGLRKVFNTSQEVVDFACSYKAADTPALNPPEWFYLNAKVTPHRYFDNTGAYHKKITYNTPSQEGNIFEYTNSDLLKPNNASSYVGFNEVYGSYSIAPGSSKPAMEIPVKFNQTYDLWIEQGTFSTCLSCGNDYYSNISKLFPSNFDFKGGGYLPHPYNTNKNISNPDHARADDHLFGRACFVPITMIPWSHKPFSDPQQQRLNRLTSQHFLFANGYQRDWYGFDYGSIIGSFDGVKWFSIGNQRRIKAKSNKLFIALNAYFGDLTTESSFRLLITLPSNVSGSEPAAKQDIESNGAQCQLYHTCVSDSDCVTQLGWDYSCQPISKIRSNWPLFDQNAEEAPNKIKSMEILKNLFGNTSGSMKRCVYRGRGAPCKPDYKLATSDTSYSGNTELGLHACNPNYYCQSFIDGVPVTKFNNKISRYGQSIKTQNVSSTVAEADADTFGHGARIIGRPFKYYGDEQINETAQGNLSYNQVTAICLPGREPTHSNSLTIKGQNSQTPSDDFLGDQFNGIGMTPKIFTKTDEMVNSCAIINDTTGNFQHLKDTASDLAKSLNDSELIKLAATQAIPTNAIKKLQEILGLSNLLLDYDSQQINEAILQKNRCLRAPGSICFSDQDCAPTDLISNAMNLIDEDDTTYSNLLNKYEISFWKENLICSQSESVKSPLYDLTRNRCCRETGKTLSIATLLDQNGDTSTNSDIPVFDHESIPGIHISLADEKRYSRISTYYKNTQDSPSDYPPLKTASPNKCSNNPLGCMDIEQLKNQFKTFNYVSAKTCCSGHWVREFDQDHNGGGHKWGPDKVQNIPMTAFKCLNWEQCDGDSCSDNKFDCAHVPDIDDPKCLARSIGNSEANSVFDWINSLELLGIPQIAVKSLTFEEVRCKVNPTDQSLDGSSSPVGGFISESTADAEYADASNDYFSADDPDNFSSSIKTIFSPDKVSCCLPLGSSVKDTTVSPSLCCSGHYDTTTLKCNLPDYSNVSLFFNKYVSSALKSLPSGYFDELTGFIKSPDVVIQLACQFNACASNKVAKGVSLSNLKVPGHEDSEKNVRRFLDGDTSANQINDRTKFYEAGLRWNNDIYCVPGDLETTSQDMAIIDCL